MNELSRLRGSERYAVRADDGAGRRTRTPDLLITNQLLYQLSYTSISTARLYYQTPCALSRVIFEKKKFVNNLRTTCKIEFGRVQYVCCFKYYYKGSEHHGKN